MTNTLKVQLFITLFLFSFNIQAQKLQNSTVKYRLRYISMDMVNDSNYIPSTVLINVNISTKLKQKIFKYNKRMWKSFLNDIKTSWVAVLLLYENNKIDANRFKVIKDYNQWIKTYQAIDLKFWNDFLEKKYPDALDNE